MPFEHIDHLAATVLSDRKIVTYRSLSRTLRVHNNVAKRMLFDFHQKQNTQQTGSVHATYLVFGKKAFEDGRDAANQHEDKEDVYMQSSPYQIDHVPHEPNGQPGVGGPRSMQVMTLVREEDLRSVEDSYESVSAIHLYSIESSVLHNLQILSDLTREVSRIDFLSGRALLEEPYGTIKASLVERRARPSAPGLAVESRGAGLEGPKGTEKDTSTRGFQRQGLKSTSSNKVETATTANEAKSQGVFKHTGFAPDHGDSSSNTKNKKDRKADLFMAFAKTKPKAQRNDETTPDSQSTMPEPQGSAVEADGTESEQDDDVLSNAEQSNVALRQARQQREKQLQEMMDEEDTTMAEVADTKDDHSQTPKQQNGELMIEAAPSVETSRGRRRGRRRIVKKTTTRDAEGFLITREEPAWESFSEDENPAPAKSKVSGTAAKNKKGSSNGSGNIMSFFGKSWVCGDMIFYGEQAWRFYNAPSSFEYIKEGLANNMTSLYRALLIVATMFRVTFPRSRTLPQ